MTYMELQKRGTLINTKDVHDGEEIYSKFLELAEAERAKNSTAAGRLVSRRKELGLSQAELAHSCGFLPQYLNRFEAGERELGNMTARNAVLLAKAIGITVEDLIAEQKKSRV